MKGNHQTALDMKHGLFFMGRCCRHLPTRAGFRKHPLNGGLNPRGIRRSPQS